MPARGESLPAWCLFATAFSCRCGWCGLCVGGKAAPYGVQPPAKSACQSPINTSRVACGICLWHQTTRKPLTVVLCACVCLTCSYQASASLKGKCKAVLKVACCADGAAPVSVSSESISVSGGSTSARSSSLAVASNSTSNTALQVPKVNVTVTNANKPLGNPLDPSMQQLSVAQMLEQAAAALQVKHQAAQALAFQQMQQLQAELLATQAKLAALGAQTQQQLHSDAQKWGMLSSFGAGWNPLAAMSMQNPAANLLSSLAPQFPAAAASQAADAQQGLPGSLSWTPVADTAATWRDSISQMMSAAKPSSWWPWSTAAQN